jgi:hypothetical protein
MHAERIYKLWFSRKLHGRPVMQVTLGGVLGR